MKLAPRYEKIYRKLPPAVWLLIGTLVLFVILSGFTNLNVMLKPHVAGARTAEKC